MPAFGHKDNFLDRMSIGPHSGLEGTCIDIIRRPFGVDILDLRNILADGVSRHHNGRI